jgi:hypothetical protein
LCVTDSIAKHNLKIRTHEDLLYKFVKLKLLKIKSIIVNSLLIWQLRLHAATYESTLFLYPIRLPNFLGHKIIQDWFIYNNWISSKCQIAYIFRTAFIEVIILVRIKFVLDPLVAEIVSGKIVIISKLHECFTLLAQVGCILKFYISESNDWSLAQQYQ